MQTLAQINIRQTRRNPATQSYRALNGSQLHLCFIRDILVFFVEVLSAKAQSVVVYG